MNFALPDGQIRVTDWTGGAAPEQMECDLAMKMRI